MDEVLNWLNNNQGIVAVILFLVGGFVTLIWAQIKKDKKISYDKSPHMSAGRDISAGGDIIVGNKISSKRKSKNESSESGVEIDLAEQKVEWEKFAIGRWVWPSFRIILSINNFRNSSPEYIRANLVAKSSDGFWEATNFIFQNPRKEIESQPNQDYRIEAKSKEKVSVFISNYDVGHREREPIPGFDKDTLKLVLKTESGREIIKPIKPGWIMGG